MRFPLWRREKDLEEEIQTHLKMAIQDRMERGDTAEQASPGAEVSRPGAAHGILFRFIKPH